MLVGVMGVTAGGVALPDLHQLPPKRLPVGPQQAPRDVDALALRCSALADGKVSSCASTSSVPKTGPVEGKQVRRHRDRARRGARNPVDRYAPAEYGGSIAPVASTSAPAQAGSGVGGEAGRWRHAGYGLTS